MKLSIVNGERREPEKGLLGECIGCGQPMIPKCGAIKIWHWAHKSQCDCDHWWENETEWHRKWKNFFPKECQEIRHKDEVTNEWHIADVKTKNGYILEFQHSFLKSEERHSRNEFYGEKLVWIVDGLKRQKDKSQFDLFLKYAMPISQNSPILKLHSFIDECTLLKEWSECKVPVFFDFGAEFSLWCLLPKSSKGNYYALECSRQNFIALHTNTPNGSTFTDLMKLLYANIFAYEYPEIVAAAKQNQIETTQAVRFPRLSLNDVQWLERQITLQQRRLRPKRFKRW